MTPKEKAKELVEKMIFQIKYNAQPSTVQFVAKQCALIAVDEILEELLEMVIVTGSSYVVKHTDYWQEVKQEIENI